MMLNPNHCYILLICALQRNVLSMKGIDELKASITWWGTNHKLTLWNGHQIPYYVQFQFVGIMKKFSM